MSDSDDDFQNPGQAVSLAQTISFHSLQNPSRKPLASPNGGIRSRKKPKTSAATGKENRAVSRARKPHLGFLGTTTRKEIIKSGAAAEKRFLFDSPGQVPMADYQVPPIGFCSSREADKGKFLASGDPNVDRDDDEGSNLRETREFTFLESEALDGSQKSTEFEREFGGYNVPEGTILLRTGRESPCLDEDELGEFEAGTQLNELMNLCEEMDYGDKFGNGADFLGGEVVDDGEIHWQSDGLLECPLCGVDITNMSEDERHAHTNNCLDRDDSSKANLHPNEHKHSPNPVIVACQVHKFLQNLGLSRYEEVFVREEIDWDTLQSLKEEDLLAVGIRPLGPRKKIMNALHELQRERAWTGVNLNEANTVTEGSMEVSTGNKLITDYFKGSITSKSTACTSNRSSLVVGSSHRTNKESCSRSTTGRNYRGNPRLRDIPSWCCIPGTPFRVDAFRFLRGDCSYWFLTHFHIDHYQGLTKGFHNGKIYCSSITAKLVHMKIGVPLDRLHVLPINEKISIAGVYVTCLDANHCPGAVIILFEPPNGKAVLHTGDFRFCDAMTNCPILRSHSVHTLILDTTYCSPQYDFPKQEAIIQFVIEAIQAETFNPETLFLIGSYTVGKERLFCEVARFLKKKVFVGAAKLRLLQCIGLPQEDMQWFTLNEMESNIHVVPMWTIASFKRMKHITNQYSGRYNLIVAFSPTGWSFGKGKKKSPGTGRRCKQGTVIRYEVPYSEHSSFTELREFVQLISPEVIIPSVNNNDQGSTDAMVSLLTSSTESRDTF